MKDQIKEVSVCPVALDDVCSDLSKCLSVQQSYYIGSDV